jgi:tetratricopeptide (TPR) repeat protein
MESKQDIVGYIGVGISFIGAVISVATSNVAMAAIPLTVGVGCNMLSRGQLSKILVDSHNENQGAIAELKQLLEKNLNDLNSNIEENQSNLSEQIKKFQEELNSKLDNSNQKLKQDINIIEAEYKQLADVVGNLREVENFSQELRVKPDSAEFYYQRGLSHQNLDNKHGAIEDYTEAIQLDANMARAYHKRGVLYLDLQERQRAVDDLRKAALLYFEQGDIESYQNARSMSRNIHNLKSNLNGSIPQSIVGGQLFS